MKHKNINLDKYGANASDYVQGGEFAEPNYNKGVKDAEGSSSLTKLLLNVAAGFLALMAAATIISLALAASAALFGAPAFPLVAALTVIGQGTAVGAMWAVPFIGTFAAVEKFGYGKELLGKNVDNAKIENLINAQIYQGLKGIEPNCISKKGLSSVKDNLQEMLTKINEIADKTGMDKTQFDKIVSSKMNDLGIVLKNENGEISKLSSFTDKFSLQARSGTFQQVTYELSDIAGHTVLSQKNSVKLAVAEFMQSQSAVQWKDTTDSTVNLSAQKYSEVDYIAAELNSINVPELTAQDQRKIVERAKEIGAMDQSKVIGDQKTCAKNFNKVSVESDEQSSGRGPTR
jgi:hypothetical protein